MGGQAGIRGYLVQVLVTILDVFQDNWTEFAIEPDIEIEKVDILWTWPDRTRAVQVKSSQNQINVSHATRWAEELQNSIAADEYELRLLGPISAGVASLGKHGKVKIPTPQMLDPAALVEQAAHKLDLYLADRVTPRLGPITRELLVNGLAAQLCVFSTKGRRIPRKEFEETISGWIESIEKESSSAESSGATVPHQLPPAPPDFTGQSDALAKLNSVLIESKAPILGVRGMGGLGKTAIAQKLSQSLIERCIDGQVYLDARGTSEKPATVEEIMRHVLLSFNPREILPPHAALYRGMCRTALFRKKILIVIEDASSSEQIEPLIPLEGSVLIFTSRKRLAVAGAVDYELPLMNANDAKSFILKIAPIATKEVDEIAKLCGYLPLALRLSASILKNRPDISPPIFVERLRDARVRLEMVEATIEISIQALGPEARIHFTMLGVFPSSFDLFAASAIWDCSIEKALQFMGKFMEFSLINWDSINRRYHLHDLLRLYAVKHCDPSDASKCLTHHSHYFLGVSNHAERVYRFGAHPLSGLAFFDQEQTNIRLGFFHAASNAEDNDAAAQVCSDYASVCLLCRDLRHSPEERAFWEQSAFDAAEKIKNGSRMVQHLGNLARALRALGKPDESIEIHRKILSIAQEMGFDRDEVIARLHIGNDLAAKGLYREAIAEYEKSMATAKANGDKLMQFHNLSNMGAAHIDLNEPEAALRRIKEALDLAPEVNDPRVCVTALANAAHVTMFTNKPELAVELYQQALTIARELRDVKNENKILRGLAIAARGIGNEELASQAIAQANSIE